MTLLGLTVIGFACGGGIQSGYGNWLDGIEPICSYVGTR